MEGPWAVTPQRLAPLLRVSLCSSGQTPSMGIATSRVLLLALVGAEALRMPSASVSRRAGALRAMAGNEDPLANPMLGFINSFQEAIQTSPAAKFKAGLAKLQAGEYDVDAVKAELNQRIKTTPCLMYSFTT